ATSRQELNNREHKSDAFRTQNRTLPKVSKRSEARTKLRFLTDRHVRFPFFFREVFSHTNTDHRRRTRQFGETQRKPAPTISAHPPKVRVLVCSPKPRKPVQ